MCMYRYAPVASVSVPIGFFAIYRARIIWIYLKNIAELCTMSRQFNWYLFKFDKSDNTCIISAFNRIKNRLLLGFPLNLILNKNCLALPFLNQKVQPAPINSVSSQAMWLKNPISISTSTNRKYRLSRDTPMSIIWVLSVSIQRFQPGEHSFSWPNVSDWLKDDKQGQSEDILLGEPFPSQEMERVKRSGGQNDDLRPFTYTLGGRGMGCRDKYVTSWDPS